MRKEWMEPVIEVQEFVALIREILPGVSACISDGYAYTISSYVPLCHSQKSHKMRSKEQYLTSRTGNAAIQ